MNITPKKLVGINKFLNLLGINPLQRWFQHYNRNTNHAYAFFRFFADFFQVDMKGHTIFF